MPDLPALARSSPTAHGASRRAVLAVAAPALVMASPVVEGAAAFVSLGAAAVLLGVVGLRAERTLAGRVLSTFVILGAAAWMDANLLERPGAVLALTLAALGAVAWIWPSRALLDVDARRRYPAEIAGVRAAGLAALVVLALAWVLDLGNMGVPRATAMAAVAWVPAWFVPIRGFGLLVPRILAYAVPIVLLALAFARGSQETDPWLLAIGPLSLLIGLAVRAAPAMPETRGPADPLLSNPALALVGGFAGACLLGTALLTLPGATRAPISLIDAAFTAVSAVCVTGLAVLDTPVDFTWLGQALILLLIQVGGLGIMTFSAAIFGLLGQRMSVLHETTAAELVGAEGHSDVLVTVRRVFLVTAITEGVGALLLFPLFVSAGDGLLGAAWRALFTSVSAFCNAGFALQSDSLIQYQHDPLVLLVVAAVILVGGLGPPVIGAIPALTRHQPVSLHVRLVLLTTAALIVVPWVLIGAIEWTGTLASMSLIERLTNALFQSVTLRTAGFNSIDLAAVRPATWTVMVFVMFIGGSPGSTAGGIKTTTFAILVIAVAAAIRRGHEVDAFGRRVPHRTVYQAASITAVGVASVVGLLFALQLTHEMPLDVAVFEVVSALATVGLSVGGTAELDGVGKLLIMLAMFAGRVGPVTLFALLAGVDERSRMRYPDARVPVG